jgi:hypothetical protein
MSCSCKLSWLFEYVLAVTAPQSWRCTFAWMLNANLRRLLQSWWLPAILATPLVAVVTRAFADQHSDNLVPAVYSAEHAFDLYLPRIFPLIQFLAFPIDDYSANLRLQVFLRVAAFCVVVVWISRRIADLLSGSRRVALVVAIGLAVYFFFRYPEAGDSIYYGVSAGMTSTAVYLISLAAGNRAQRAGSRLVGGLWVFVALALGLAASLYYVTVLLWAWLLLLIDYGSQTDSARSNKSSPLSEFFRRAGVQISVLLAAAFAAVVYLRAGSGENTGLSFGRSARVVLRTRYLWERSNFYILENFLLIMGIAIVVVMIARSFRSLFVAAIGVVSGLGVFAIAALDHVAENVHLPRYYAPNLFIGLLIVVSALASATFNRVNLERSGTDRRAVSQGALSLLRRRLSPSMYKVFAGTIAAIGLVMFIRAPIGFGYEGSDGQQIRKQGRPLPVRDIQAIERDAGVDVTFVTGSHWQSWVTVFASHELGEDLFPVAPFTRAFARPKQFIPVVPTYGVCLDLTDGQCVEVAQSMVPPDTDWRFSVVSGATASGGRIVHVLKLDRQ